MKCYITIFGRLTLSIMIFVRVDCIFSGIIIIFADISTPILINSVVL